MKHFFSVLVEIWKFVSRFLENLEEMFHQYYIYSNVCGRFKSTNTLYGMNCRESVNSKTEKYIYVPLGGVPISESDDLLLATSFDGVSGALLVVGELGKVPSSQRKLQTGAELWCTKELVWLDRQVWLETCLGDGDGGLTGSFK